MVSVRHKARARRDDMALQLSNKLHARKRSLIFTQSGRRLEGSTLVRDLTGKPQAIGERRPNLLSRDYRGWPHCRFHNPRAERTKEKSPVTPSARSAQTKK